MLIFETIIFVFSAVFGAVVYGIATSKRRAIVERAKKAQTELSTEDKKALEDLRAGRAKVAGWFWLMAALMLIEIVSRLIWRR